MKNIIQISISQEKKMYIAQGVNVPIVTSAKTFEKLKKNIQEAVALFFDGEDNHSLGFGKYPVIMTSFELQSKLHGIKA